MLISELENNLVADFLLDAKDMQPRQVRSCDVEGGFLLVDYYDDDAAAYIEFEVSWLEIMGWLYAKQKEGSE